MKFPRFFHFKCPSLERITYHCLRVLGILIGIAAIVYFMYDGKIRDDGSRRKAQERLIRRRIVIVIIYSCWIVGIILEKSILMWFVLYVVIIAFAYCVFTLLSVLLSIFSLWIHHADIPGEAYMSLVKYSLTSVFFLLLLLVHYFIYKMVDQGIKACVTQNEETTLLNKGKNATANGNKKCGIKFPCCV
ncbi:uncharacterized protein LOC129568903 [Sitodiplosis mosellana]|uniref:uncharacterized protein LOC129568903 n=1 Tax=Sitodiplosis mosellana TaxID=263140 RepID=UPI0024438FF5|nr:uncharacterized protein LOC129568903 [Sitodiplosis mosellana]